MVYLDNGASSHPKPHCVIQAMTNWMNRNGANPGRSGHRLSMEAAELIYNTRVEFCEMFGMNDPEKIILVPGATYALNTVLLGLFKPGDHLITTDLEHNSILRPLWHLKKKGIDVSIVPVDFFNEEKTVDAIMEKVQPSTKAIICTQCSNVCGYRMPIKRISARKPKNILLIVDGAQGAGIIETNVKEMGIDYYCAPSHKGLMGPQGGGLLILNNTPPEPLVYGGTGTESMHFEQPSTLPEKLESGTLSAPICAGMLAAAKYLKGVGQDKVFQRKKELTAYAYEELRSVRKVELYMHPVKEKCLSVIPFNVTEKSSDEVSNFLNENGICVRSGLHCAPLFHHRMKTVGRGMVRASLGWFNSERDVDMLVRYLKKI